MNPRDKLRALRDEFQAIADTSAVARFTQELKGYSPEELALLGTQLSATRKRLTRELNALADEAKAKELRSVELKLSTLISKAP